MVSNEKDPLIIDLKNSAQASLELIGGKGLGLAKLMSQGFSVAPGFCITSRAYFEFVREHYLIDTINYEIGRKPIADMRWEEIWDSALRIRSAFICKSIPKIIFDLVKKAYETMNAKHVVVRSSALTEDGLDYSFAGAHDSVINVSSLEKLEQAIRQVWASLWSDHALMFAKELNLDPKGSAMAIVIQEQIVERVSGIAFSINPLRHNNETMIVESVAGPCESLVSGAAEPDRWELRKKTGEVLTWHPSKTRKKDTSPPLSAQDLKHIHGLISSIEKIRKHPVDVEWTATDKEFIVLQARPISRRQNIGYTGQGMEASNDKRAWYLSLKRSADEMDILAKKITEQLIPQLKLEIAELAKKSLTNLAPEGIVDVISDRNSRLTYWQQIYHDEFIPFAHGVRQFGVFYNDVIKPKNPFEFIGLLLGQSLLATSRNTQLLEIAKMVKKNNQLRVYLMADFSPDITYAKLSQKLQDNGIAERKLFMEKLEEYEISQMNLLYSGDSLQQGPGFTISTILEIAKSDFSKTNKNLKLRSRLEKKLFEKLCSKDSKKAIDLLHTARLSWKLRDDDNILMGQLEHEVLRAVRIGGEILVKQNRLSGDKNILLSHSNAVIAGLKAKNGSKVVLPPRVKPSPTNQISNDDFGTRQLSGQPAAVGLARGKARVVSCLEDLKRFQKNEILVCDVVEPTMTYIMPLAAAIVERRGGMLIHSTIIARELGIPCVNGVADATLKIESGCMLAVDGYLGVVTIGDPEFAVELGID